MSKREQEHHILTEEEAREIEYSTVCKILASSAGPTESKTLSVEVELHTEKITYVVLNRKTRDCSYSEKFSEALESYNNIKPVEVKEAVTE